MGIKTKTKLLGISLVLASLVVACNTQPNTSAFNTNLAGKVSNIKTRTSLQGKINFSALPSVSKKTGAGSEFSVKASAADVSARSTVALLYPNDYPTVSLRNTTVAAGLTDETNGFEINPNPSFNPQLNDVFILEGSKRIGGAGNDDISLRTHVKWNGTGWESITTSGIYIDSATTALAIISSLNPSAITTLDTIGKISFSNTGVPQITDINTTINTIVTAASINSVKDLVEQLLLTNKDPLAYIYLSGGQYTIHQGSITTGRTFSGCIGNPASCNLPSNAPTATPTPSVTASPVPGNINYDAARDFSLSNPSGVWKYGWYSPSNPSFTLYTNPQLLSNGTLESWSTDFWTTYAQGFIGRSLPAKTLSTHPGTNNADAIIRWTAPGAATDLKTYDIQADYKGLTNDPANPALKTTTSCFIRAAKNSNGQLIAAVDGNINVNNGGNEASLKTILTVNGGDVIDFIVSDGGNGISYDSTGVNVVITPVTIPSFYGEFKVNNTTAGEQTTPKTAVDSDGNYVVTWESNDGSGFGIFAQRYNKNGQQQGPQFKVNTTTTSEQLSPAIAMSNSGNFVITWDSHHNLNNWVVMGQRFDSNGNRLGNEFQVSTTANAVQSKPSVGIDNLNNFVITWQNNTTNGNASDIFARKYTIDTNNAAQPGSVITVNSNVSNDQIEPGIAMKSSGDFVITWTSKNGSNGSIYARLFNSSAAAQGTDIAVTSSTTYNQLQPAAAIDSTGNFVIVWATNQEASNYGIYAKRYDSSGTALGTEFLVNNTYIAANQSQPSIGMDSSGNFTISWNNSASATDTTFDIFAARYNSAGVVQGSTFLANTFTATDQHRPSIGMNGTGNSVISWQSKDQDGDGYGIYAKRYGSDGSVK